MLRCLAASEPKHGQAPPSSKGLAVLNNAVENTRSLARDFRRCILERGDFATRGRTGDARAYGIRSRPCSRTNSTGDQPRNGVAKQSVSYRAGSVTNASSTDKPSRCACIHRTHGKVRLSITTMARHGENERGKKHSILRHGGMGLRIMRYRARSHGRRSLRHGQPSGTRVVCECPLDRDGDQEDRHSIARSHGVVERGIACALTSAALGSDSKAPPQVEWHT